MCEMKKIKLCSKLAYCGKWRLCSTTWH